MSRTKIKTELTSDRPPVPRIKCEFYPQEFPHKELFQCSFCGALLEEEAFTDHVRSHHHPPVKCEPEEEKEEVKPSIIDLALPEVDIPAEIPAEESRETTTVRSFPFPIVDFEMTSKTSTNSKIIYTCSNPDELYYKCDVCSFTASKQLTLSEHKKCHDPAKVQSNVMKCSKCSFNTTSKEMFRMHSRGHRKRKMAELESTDAAIKTENVF